MNESKNAKLCVILHTFFLHVEEWRRVDVCSVNLLSSSREPLFSVLVTWLIQYLMTLTSISQHITPISWKWSGFTAATLQAAASHITSTALLSFLFLANYVGAAVHDLRLRSVWNSTDATAHFVAVANVAGLSHFLVDREDHDYMHVVTIDTRTWLSAFPCVHNAGSQVAYTYQPAAYPDAS